MKLTYQKCKEEALKYKTRSEFQKKNHRAYQFSYRKNWLDNICAHMITLRKKKFTFKKCEELASKCESRNEFNKKYNSAYHATTNNNWLNDICDHMKEIIKPKGYWTYDKCKKEAMKYNTKSELVKNNSSVYNTINLNKWLELLEHMKIIGNRYNKCIYALEFSNNHTYVGLTYNIKKRYNEHISDKKSSVYKYIKQTNLTPKLIKLTEYLPVDDAIKKEEYWVNFYRNKNWIILNKIKTGAVGSKIDILTKEYCKNLSKLCKSRTQYSIEYNSAYRKSLKNNWIDEFFPKKYINWS